MVSSIFNFVFSVVALLVWSITGSRQKGKIKRLTLKSSFLLAFWIIANAIILVISVYNY